MCKLLLLTLSLILLFLFRNCGTMTQYAEHYESGDNLVDVGPVTTRLMINSEQQISRLVLELLFTGKTTHGAPYILSVASHYQGLPPGPLLVKEILLYTGVNPQAITVHSQDETPLQLHYRPWLDETRNGSVRIPLGDTLGFSEDYPVTVTLRYQIPGSSEVHTLSSTFVGMVSERTYTFLDVIMSA